MTRKKFSTLLILAWAAFLTGCAGSSMVTAPDQEIQQPPAGEAQVIFLRPSSLGAAISASLFEIVDDEIRFIGISTHGTAVPYRTTPGRHVFMVASEAADFMEADLAPGRNYFSLVTPRMGVWAARFSLWPVKAGPDAEYTTDSSKFSQWVEGARIVENTDESRAWYEENAASVRAKYEKYWPAWQKKSAEEVAMRTLEPGDGL